MIKAVSWRELALDQFVVTERKPNDVETSVWLCLWMRECVCLCVWQESRGSVRPCQGQGEPLEKHCVYVLPGEPPAWSSRDELKGS